MEHNTVHTGRNQVKNTWWCFFSKPDFEHKSSLNRRDQLGNYVQRRWTTPCPPWTASILVSLCEATLICPSEAAQWPTSDHCGYSGQLPSVPSSEGHSHLCVCVALWAACFMCDRCVTGMCLGQVTGETPLGNSKRLDHSLFLPVFFLSLFLSLLLPSFTQPRGETLPLPPFLLSSLPLTDCQEIGRFLCLKKKYIIYLYKIYIIFFWQ